MHTDTKWPEKSPIHESLMDNGCVCSDTPSSLHPRECLFCLEGDVGGGGGVSVSGDYDDSDKAQPQPPLQQGPVPPTGSPCAPPRPPPPSPNTEQTDLESGIPVQTHATKEMFVLDYGELFPCECSVYSHGHCLQIWLDNEQCCPICKRPIEHVKSPTNRTSSPPLHALHTLHTLHTIDSESSDGDNTRRASPVSYGLRLCCYSGVCIAVAVFIWYSSHN